MNIPVGSHASASEPASVSEEIRADFGQRKGMKKAVALLLVLAWLVWSFAALSYFEIRDAVTAALCLSPRK